MKTPLLGLCTLATSPMLPLAALALAIHPRLRGDLAARLGLRPPPIEPGALWFHAASLGEGRVVHALTRPLSRRRPNLPLLRTATSAAGIRQDVGVDASSALPLDHPLCLAPFLRRVRPRALVLVEGELWPCLLALTSRRIPVAMLGARVGPRTRTLAHRAPAFFRALLARIQRWSARDDVSADFLAPFLGFRPIVIGDLKIGAPAPPRGFEIRRPYVVAGSTHAPEETLLIEALRNMPDPPLLVLAPRHAERFDEVAAMLRGTGLRWARRGQLAGEGLPVETEVLLLDTTGELASLYSGARAAFVGGTFKPEIGGHSAAEAGRAGLAVVRGPHHQANASSFDGLRVFLATNARELADALDAAGREPARPVSREGDVAQALAWLEPLLDAPVPGERVHRASLLPLAPVYLAASRLRRALRRPDQAALPVIAIGSVGSGGVGKTPVALEIARRLVNLGHRPAILLRGHRRAPEGPALRIGGPDRASACFLGDEGALAARASFLVVSCPDRARAAEAARAEGADVLVLDDGLSQRDLLADLRICVVDARHPRAGGLLPAGEARERPRGYGVPDMLWVHHGSLPEAWTWALEQGARLVRARFVLGEPRRLPDDAPLPWRLGDEAPDLRAFAGIARPEAFFRMLRGAGANLCGKRIFPDHHAYSAQELEDLAAWGAGRVLVTTAKDAVRIRESAPDFDCAVLPMALCLEEGESLLDEALGHIADPRGSP